MEKLKISIEFEDSHQESRMVIFQDFRFLPDKGSTIRLDSKSEQFIVKDKIQHLADPNCDFTLVLSSTITPQ